MLKPFFCYYGGKWRAAPKYPAPLHDTIVEPFAGAAGYSTRHHTRKVILVDANPKVVGVWRYLIASKPEDILALPSRVEHIDDVKAPEEARWLIGFWLNKGTTHPSNTPSAWARRPEYASQFWGAAIKERLASQVEHIKHWKVHESDYNNFTTSPEATWFVDPPYDNAAGARYDKQVLDYGHLATWCRCRRGQVIVCENAGATWLPFVRFGDIKARLGASSEVIWTNDDAAKEAAA